jgi:hypothetical protein
MQKAFAKAINERTSREALMPLIEKCVQEVQLPDPFPSLDPLHSRLGSLEDHLPRFRLHNDKMAARVAALEAALAALEDKISSSVQTETTSQQTDAEPEPEPETAPKKRATKAKKATKEEAAEEAA